MTKDETIIKTARVLCSEYYRGIFTFTNDDRNDVYLEKVENNLHSWIPQARSLLKLIEYKDENESTLD